MPAVNRKTLFPGRIIGKDLESAILEFLNNRSQPPAKKRFEALNSPFVVTLIGGIILAVISSIFTQCTTTNARNLETSLAALRQRQVFIDTFDNKIEEYLMLTHSLRKKEIFLFLWQDKPERNGIKYPDGRNFAETTAQWEQEKRYWIEHWPGSPIALVHLAKVLFRKGDTLKKLEEMRVQIENYARTNDYDELDSAYNQVVIDLGLVTSLLENEAREK